MKKIAVVLLVLIPIWGFSQSSHFKVKLGAGIPSNEYKVLDDGEGAYSKLGGNFQFSFERKFNDYVGIKSSLAINTNAIDEDETIKLFESIYPGYIIEANTGSYLIGSLMFGMLGSIPVGEIFFIDLYGVMGYSVMDDPGTKVDGYDYFNNTIHFESERAGSGSISYMFGGDLNFLISEKVGIGAGISYLGTKAKFKDVDLTQGNNNRKYDYDYKIGVLNIDFCLNIFL